GNRERAIVEDARLDVDADLLEITLVTRDEESSARDERPVAHADEIGGAAGLRQAAQAEKTRHDGCKRFHVSLPLIFFFRNLTPSGRHATFLRSLALPRPTARRSAE